MTLDELQALLPDQDAFRRALRRDDVVALLKGQFREGRLPNIHQVTFPNGSQLRIKFYDTVKRLFNSKNIELIGKESFLSYMEVSVLPAGSKGYFYTTDVNQIVWGMSKTKALVKHNAAVAAILDFATSLDITPVWTTVYTENY